MVSEHTPSVPPAACPGCAGTGAHTHVPPPPPVVAAGTCALCGAPLPAGADRCPDCGNRLLTAAPPRFGPRAVAVFVAVFVACYAAALAAVAAAR